jgi:large repetitive protein
MFMEASMKRLLFTSCYLILLSGCATNNSGALSAGATQSATVQTTANAPTSSPSVNFTTVGNMTIARANHIAVLLPNGKVLIAGGEINGFPSQALASAELYDPSTRTFTPTGNMTTPRGHAAALPLPNGKVLVAGGAQDLSAELYDPSTGTFTATGSMISGVINSNVAIRLTLLQNGKVLVGTINAQIYDPATGTFALTVAYADANPLWFTANLLLDGRVLFTGCVGPSSCSAGATELFDFQTITFSSTAPLKQWDDENTATLLMNGKVLFVGNAENDGLPADAELYDPTAGTFTSLGSATAPHEFAAAVRLNNGTVLITGGQLPGGSGSSGTDLYDPASGTFTSAGNMTATRHSHTATLLPDGTVLITGGHTSWPASTSSAEIYSPASPWDY